MSDSNRDIDVVLINAAKRGDTNEVKLLISEGADVNATDTNHNNSLCWAVENNHFDTAKVLLDNGADFITFDSAQARHMLNKYEEVKAEHCKVSLHLAARLGNLKAVEDLLGKGADVNVKNDKGETPLHYAAQNNNEEIVMVLIEADVNIRDQNRKTPLDLAADKGIQNLLQSVKKDANDKLLEAAKSGNIYAVENLLNEEGKAQVNAKNEFEETPLHLAAQNGHKDVVEFLFSKGAKVDVESDSKNTPLHFAAQYGHKDVVEFLFSKGAKVDAESDSLSTPLHFAAKSRYKDTEKIVKFLLDKGADVNAQNDAGETPLHLILKKADLDIDRDKFYTLLDKKGINVNLTDENKDTPLHLFLKKNVMDTYALSSLLEAESINVNLQNIDGKTPLHLVIEKSNWNTLSHVPWSREMMVDILIKMEAIVDAVDKYERTPLHWAAVYGRKEIVEALINAEANVGAQDKYGKTPFDLTTDEEIKTLLQNAEKTDPVDESSTDSKGNQEEDAGTEKKEGDAKSESDTAGQNPDNTEPQSDNNKKEEEKTNTISAEKGTDIKAEGVKAVAPIEPAQTEEQPSSFFGSLFSILMKPFSLIGSFFGGFFSWLFGSDEPIQSSSESAPLVESDLPPSSSDDVIL